MEKLNALSLADLVSNMMRIEKESLFREKEDLGEFTEFEEYIAKNNMVSTAREALQYRI